MQLLMARQLRGQTFERLNVGIFFEVMWGGFGHCKAFECPKNVPNLNAHGAHEHREAIGEVALS